MSALEAGSVWLDCPVSPTDLMHGLVGSLGSSVYRRRLVEKARGWQKSGGMAEYIVQAVDVHPWYISPRIWMTTV